MSQPRVELLPLRPAVRSDAVTTLDLLIKITPPPAELNAPRPALNLGLVIDRSGSMDADKKIKFAREAAVYAVEQLLPTDRVSVTVFDGEVQTLVENAPAVDKAGIVGVIRRVVTGGSTALHGGWSEGGKQVGGHLIAGGMNRVLLLSDGQANMGEQNPATICADVARLAAGGVGTTTMGLGDDYNEDLLEAMAQAGDGNYYYIESPQQLGELFQTELHGLMATFGHAVRLGLEPHGGVTVADVLNDFEPDQLGAGLKLPNLVAGMPILAVVRLNVPPPSEAGDILRVRVSWLGPKQTARQELVTTLTLPAVSSSAFDALPVAVEVQERAALLLMARLKKQATHYSEQGDLAGTLRSLTDAKQILACAPPTAEMQQEADAFALIEADLAEGEVAKFSKRAKFQSHQTRSSKPRP